MNKPNLSLSSMQAVDMLHLANCPLCTGLGGELVFECKQFRVIWADEPLYPGFLRVVWNFHVQEFSELLEADQWLCMRALVVVERFVCEHMQPDKVNLATLGNVVPHLHWHVIPRFKEDAHFPAPVWAAVPEGASICAKQVQVLSDKEALIVQLKKALEGFL